MALQKSVGVKSGEAKSGGEFVMGELFLAVEFDNGGLFGGLVEVVELTAEILLNFYR